MKRITRASVVAAFALLLTVSSAVRAQGLDGATLQRTVFTRLLLDDDPDKSRLAARFVAQYPASAEKQVLSDLLAEHLLYLVNSTLNEDPLMIDSVAWHIEALKSAGPARYRSVLEAAGKRYKQDKVAERIRQALSVAGATDAGFIPNAVDVPGLRAELDAVLATNRKQDRKQFSRLHQDTGLEVVLETLGTPDDISFTTVRVAQYGRSQYLTTHYLGAGFILFRRGAVGQPLWIASEFVDELFDVREIYKGEQVWAAQTLASLRGVALRAYMQTEKARVTSDSGLMDVMEHRLLLPIEPADHHELAGLVTGLRLIARSNRPNKLEALRKMADVASVERLQREAKIAIRRIEQGKVNEPEREDSAEVDNESDLESAKRK